MTIDSFKDEYSWLSNMHPCMVEYEKRGYMSSESAYQAAKCANPEEKKQFFLLDGYQAKKLGRTIKIRDDWNEVKLYVMTTIIENKFALQTQLGFRLLETGNAELIEGNTWNDTYWGICNGVGENHLGKILMVQRQQLLLYGTTVGVVGSRTFTNSKLIFDVLDRANKKFNFNLVVSGGANGADSIAEKWALQRGIDCDTYLPDWNTFGKSAGFRRNYQIVEASEFIIAFWDMSSRGTKHSMDTAFEAGKRVYYFRPDGQGFKYDPKNFLR